MQLQPHEDLPGDSTAFSLLGQASIGALLMTGGLQAFLTLVPSGAPSLGADQVTIGFSASAVLMAIGVEITFYQQSAPEGSLRVLLDFRKSWTSRAIVSGCLYFGFCVVSRFLMIHDGLMPRPAAYILPGLAGVVSLVSMSMAQRLRTVPIWSAWYLPTTFSVTSILLGASVVALILVVRPIVPVWIDRVCLWMLGLTVIVFLTVQVLLFSLWFQRIVSFAVIIVALHEKPLKGIPTLFWMRFLSAGFGLLALTGSAVLGERWLEPGILFTVGAVVVSEVSGRLVFSQVRMPEDV